jgi:hypothetical protein
MNLKVEEILMVIVAFLIGWFVSNMISGSKNNSIVKVFSGKHTIGRICYFDEYCDMGERCVPNGNNGNNGVGKCVEDTRKGSGEECHYNNDCKRPLDCGPDPNGEYGGPYICQQ